jgi:uncharacterized peroxidase-related enzyme
LYARHRNIVSVLEGIGCLRKRQGDDAVARARDKARKTKTVAEKRNDPKKKQSPASSRGGSSRAAHDDKEVMALKLKPAPLTPAMADLFKLCEEKLGFVPNVFKAFSFDMAKLEGFVGYRNSIMQGESGLTKVEQEMIATAVSTQNRCYYCVTSHGSAVRGLSGDPILGEQIVMNYRAAGLDKRQRAMLDFAVKLTVEPWTIEEDDRERLRRAGFSDRDIWDIAAIAGFFNMTNRIASAIDMRPNSQYHAMGR